MLVATTKLGPAVRCYGSVLQMAGQCGVCGCGPLRQTKIPYHRLKTRAHTLFWRVLHPNGAKLCDPRTGEHEDKLPGYPPCSPRGVVSRTGHKDDNLSRYPPYGPGLPCTPHEGGESHVFSLVP
jgi:hypothetical protein